MNIKELVGLSFPDARAMPIDKDSKKHRNRQRSEAFVDELSNGLRRAYLDPSVRIFSRRNYSNYRHFGLNELLHDIWRMHRSDRAVPSPQENALLR